MDIIVSFDMDHIGANNRHYEQNICFNYKKELTNLFEFFDQKKINSTAFVRIDKEIKTTFDDYLHVLKMLPKSKTETEIAWHPHIEPDKCAAKELHQIYNENPIIKQMKCVRMGGGIMDNDIMATLNGLGFKVDSSALPGCRRNDKHRKYDWLWTGNNYYKPCIHDYQMDGSVHHNITEIPMTTCYISAPYDKCLQRRYLNPTIRKEIFQQAIEDFYPFAAFLVIVFHPDQLIAGYEDDLYKYGMNNFIENMEFIDDLIENKNYVTMSKFYEKI